MIGNPENYYKIQPMITYFIMFLFMIFKTYNDELNYRKLFYEKIIYLRLNQIKDQIIKN